MPVIGAGVGSLRDIKSSGRVDKILLLVTDTRELIWMYIALRVKWYVCRRMKFRVF